MGQKISFEFNKPEKKIVEETTGGDQAQLFLANEARKLMAYYVPELSGSRAAMVDNVRTYVENGHGVVHYLSPYARFQYHGKLMLSGLTGSSWSHGEKKVLTNIDLKYSKSTATSHWDKAMKTARGDDLRKAVQNHIKKKEGG